MEKATDKFENKMFSVPKANPNSKALRQKNPMLTILALGRYSCNLKYLDANKEVTPVAMASNNAWVGACTSTTLISNKARSPSL